MYEKSITRQNRGLFVVAIDCSASMQERIAFNSLDVTKSEAVTIVCNYILDELLARATRYGEVRDYYDIAVVGYSGDAVMSLLPTAEDGITSISNLATYAPEPQTYHFEQHLDDGTTTLATFSLRPWVKPMAEGKTPMYAAMLHIEELVNKWCGAPQNRNSFPPLVFNISDGECSDGNEEDLASIAERIRSLATHDGNTLLINIHLSTDDSTPSVAFPSNGLFSDIDSFRRMLFTMSSILPENMEPLIAELVNPGSYGPYRCVAFNASINELMMILAIGSESLKKA